MSFSEQLLLRVAHSLVWRLITLFAYALQGALGGPTSRYPFKRKRNLVEIRLYTSSKSAICLCCNEFIPSPACDEIIDYPPFKEAELDPSRDYLSVFLDDIEVTDFERLSNSPTFPGAFLKTPLSECIPGQLYKHWTFYKCNDIKSKLVRRYSDALNARVDMEEWTVYWKVREPTDDLTIEINIADNCIAKDITAMVIDRDIQGRVIFRRKEGELRQKTIARNRYEWRLRSAKPQREYEIRFQTYTPGQLASINEFRENEKPIIRMATMNIAMSYDTLYYHKGQLFRAISDIVSIMKSCKEELIIVDPFIDGDLLKHLAGLPRDLSISILTQKSYPDNFPALLQSLRKQREGRTECVISYEYHDRFLISDSRAVFVLGGSIKDFGSKY